MSCNHEGSTHFACDCVLEQLNAADALAKATKIFRSQERPYRTVDARAVDDALAVYEKVRGK